MDSGFFAQSDCVIGIQPTAMSMGQHVVPDENAAEQLCAINTWGSKNDQYTHTCSLDTYE